MTPDRPGPTRLLLLRHAETAAPDLFHGAESDIGLGPRGLAQADRVAARLARERPHAVVSSGMRRADETAGPIARASGLRLDVEPRLHERRMGPVSGTSRAASWSIYDESRTRWIAGDLDQTHPGGESFAQIAARVAPAIASILARGQGRTTVVVAHGVTNRVILATLVADRTPADFDAIPIEFVGVHDLRLDPDGSTLRLHDYWPGEPNTPVIGFSSPPKPG